MRQKGFGIIELVVVVAIVLIISNMAIVSSINFRKSRALNNSVETIRLAVKEAQERTLASENSYQYGAHFDADKVVVFRGASYSSSDSNNVPYLVSDEAEISATSLVGGGTNMVFNKITGRTSQSGTITVRLKVDTSMTKVLTISPSFAISIQ